MNIAVCIDDRGGMEFHQRRQSMDRAVRADLIGMLCGAKLWMSTRSFRQFEDEAYPIAADEGFLAKARPGDFCFVEDRPLRPWLDRIERMILYCWNRTYPADRYLDIDPRTEGWRLEERKEFPGHSHQKITKEVYSR